MRCVLQNDYYQIARFYADRTVMIGIIDAAIQQLCKGYYVPLRSFNKRTERRIRPDRRNLS